MEKILLLGKNIRRFLIRKFREFLLSLVAMLTEESSNMNKYKNQIREHNGIKYRSQLELTCATLLEENGIKFEYEPYEVLLIEGCKYPGKVYEKRIRNGKKVYIEGSNKVRKISYTPDFVGNNWIIETKGFETAEFKLKWKLFKRYLINNKKSPFLFKPTNKREILETISIIKQIENESKRTEVQTQGRRRQSHSRKGSNRRKSG